MSDFFELPVGDEYNLTQQSEPIIFNRFDLIKLGYEEREAQTIIQTIAKSTPCESKSVMHTSTIGGKKVVRARFVVMIDADKAISVCDMKLKKDHIGTNTKRWEKLKKKLTAMKEPRCNQSGKNTERI